MTPGTLWARFRDHCYFFDGSGSERKLPDEAEPLCTAHGGYVTIPNDAGENQWLDDNR